MLSLLWIPATIAAAAAQTARNAMQRHLTATLGTVGATQVRFLYGLPFGLLFLGAALLLSGASLPGMTPKSIAFTVVGAVAQILATGLMLLLTLGFSWWVSRFGNYNQLYGSIGTVLILMLLIYFNSMILLIGFELNVSITSLKKIADERKDNPAEGSDNLK